MHTRNYKLLCTFQVSLKKKNLLLPYIFYHTEVSVRKLLCPSTLLWRCTEVTGANINQFRHQHQWQVCRHSTLAARSRQSSAPLNGRNWNFQFIQTSLPIPKVPLQYSNDIILLYHRLWSPFILILHITIKLKIIQNKIKNILFSMGLIIFTHSIAQTARNGFSTFNKLTFINKECIWNHINQVISYKLRSCLIKVMKITHEVSKS